MTTSAALERGDPPDDPARLARDAVEPAAPGASTSRAVAASPTAPARSSSWTTPSPRRRSSARSSSAPTSSCTRRPSTSAATATCSAARWSRPPRRAVRARSPRRHVLAAPCLALQLLAGAARPAHARLPDGGAERARRAHGGRALETIPTSRRSTTRACPSHPGHEIARRQMSGFGAMLSFRAAGGREAALRPGRARLFTRATSPRQRREPDRAPRLQRRAGQPDAAGPGPPLDRPRAPGRPHGGPPPGARGGLRGKNVHGSCFRASPAGRFPHNGERSSRWLRRARRGPPGREGRRPDKAAPPAKASKASAKKTAGKKTPSKKTVLASAAAAVGAVAAGIAGIAVARKKSAAKSSASAKKASGAAAGKKTAKKSAKKRAKKSS